MDLEKIGINAGNLVNSAQDKNYWRALVKAGSINSYTINYRSHPNENLCILKTYDFIIVGLLDFNETFDFVSYYTLNIFQNFVYILYTRISWIPFQFYRFITFLLPHCH